MLVRDLLKNISDDFVTVSPDVDIQRAAANSPASSRNAT